MTPSQFRAALERAGLNYTDAAELFRCDPRTANKWALGQAPIPPGVAILVRLLQRGKITVDDIADAGDDGDRRTRRD